MKLAKLIFLSLVSRTRQDTLTMHTKNDDYILYLKPHISQKDILEKTVVKL